MGEKDLPEDIGIMTADFPPRALVEALGSIGAGGASGTSAATGTSAASSEGGLGVLSLALRGRLFTRSFAAVGKCAGCRENQQRDCLCEECSWLGVHERPFLFSPTAGSRGILDVYAPECNRQDTDVLHMGERLARLDKAIDHLVASAPPHMQAVIEALLTCPIPLTLSSSGRRVSVPLGSCSP